MSRVTVIGKSSFLARHLAAAYPDWTYLDYQDALSETKWVRETDVVINCAFHPDLKTGDYSPVKDIDFLLSGYIAASHVHYVMLSSRAVYGEAQPDDHILHEVHIPMPTNAYGKNKYMSEEAVEGILPPERLTIIRSANIFGSEYGRSTFFGLMLTSLKDEGVLRFNIAPDAVRDFLSARKWAQYLGKIADNPKSGIYNLGSGQGTTTQDLADLMIKYNGSGTVEYSGKSYNGQFILDMSKAKQDYGLDDYSSEEFEDDVKAALI